MIVFDRISNLNSYAFIDKELKSLVLGSSFPLMSSGVYKSCNMRVSVTYIIPSPKGTSLMLSKGKMHFIALLEEEKYQMIKIGDAYFKLDSSHFLYFDEDSALEAIGDYDKFPIKRVLIEI